jgi:hypothetical protein
MRTLIVKCVFALLLSCSAAIAQQPPPLPTVKLSDLADATPAQCQFRTPMLDYMNQDAGSDGVITVIARLGDGDIRPNLNRRRLYNVRAYWTEFPPQGQRRKPETIILKEGERVKGYGRMEFYLGENLVYVLKIARNSDVDFGNCYPPDDSYIRKGIYNACWVKSQRVFYPCRDMIMRRKRNG